MERELLKWARSESNAHPSLSAFIHLNAGGEHSAFELRTLNFLEKDNLNIFLPPFHFFYFLLGNRSSLEFGSIQQSIQNIPVFQVE